MDLGKVGTCGAEDCAYNEQKTCHAVGITVGNGSHVTCDTYYPEDYEAGLPDALGMVGACRVSKCRFNDHLLCTATAIELNKAADEVQCMTFAEV